MKYVDSNIKLRYRFVLSLGAITPDLVMIFPQHQVYLTKDKVNRFLDTINNSDKLHYINILKLGICLHYICDYFCRAHNDAVILHGIKHSRYELDVARKVKYFEELRNIPCINNVSDFDNLLKSEHKKYIKGLISGQSDVNRDVEEAFKVGVGLISAYKKALVKK